MATTITPVTANNIKHCLLIILTVDGTTYYLSNAYKTISYNGNDYTELGSLLSVSAMSDDVKTTNGDIQISLSGIPAGNITTVLTANVKGGIVQVYRAFLNDDYSVNTVVQRFKGLITNFSIAEDVDLPIGDITKNITVSVASINTILENKISGQRTNPTDRVKFYPGDSTFYRVPDLHNVNFDFGREYTGGTGYGGGGRGGGGPGGGNPFNGIDFNLR